MEAERMTGLVFDIKEFTVHDGPGARVTVFLKGCPLRCKWCHNPEGLTVSPQLMYKEALCTHCGACFTPCDHPECKPFGRCLHACPNGCLSIAGEKVSDTFLAQKLQKYADILRQMEGGVTFSGGEPLLQAAFVQSVVGKLQGIHTALQTSGYADAKTYRETVCCFDYVLQDIKLADPAAHKKYTGVDNGCILDNIRWLKESGKDFVFRLPLIPNITDTPENLRQIAQIVGDAPVELMPYNSVAGAKYAMVGMEYTLSSEKNRAEDFTRYFQNAVII